VRCRVDGSTHAGQAFQKSLEQTAHWR
jgi:hypothetical protein